MRTETKESPKALSYRRAGHLGLLFILFLTGLFLVSAASASADSTLCTSGSGAGQCEGPQGVAVDRSNGQVYVADGNNRIDVFDSAGGFLFAFGWGVADGITDQPQKCTTKCFPGIGGPGPGQQQESGGAALAIDNDPASPSYRDLYVGESNNVRVQKFSPDGEFILMLGKGVNKTTGKNICTAASGNTCGVGASGGGDGEFDGVVRPAVGLGGTLYVADTARSGGQVFGAARVQAFEPSGAFIARVVLLAEPSQTRDLAIDSFGNFYLGFGGINGNVRKYDAGGNLVGTLSANDLNSLATDASDNLYAAESVGGRAVITKYGPGGTLLGRFGYGSIEETPSGIALNEAGDVYGSEPSRNRVVQVSALAPGPLPCCLRATTGNTKATLEGGVNPENKATTYHFDYVDDAGFKAGGFKSTPETAAGSDFDLHDAEAEIGCANPEVPPQLACLTPGTLYHYRLVASNADGENETEGTFTTKPPLEITETYATDVGTDAGRLGVTVNPLGLPTTGYFEYVDQASYEADLALGEGHDGFAQAAKSPNVDQGQAPIDFGSGEAPKGATAELFSLVPGTTYRYRFVATDPFLSEAGPVRTLRTFPVPAPPSNSCPNQTFRFGPSAVLPDCRAYEMVSPVDKNGGEIKVLGSTLNYPARLEQSAADGNRFAFSSVTSFGDAVSAPWTSEYIATRKEGEEWSTHGISPARESHSITQTPAFKFDLQYKAFSEDLSSAWLIHDTEPPLDPCAPEGTLNLYRRDNITGAYEALTTALPTNIGPDGYELELQGVSADGTSAIIRANGKLTPNGAKNGLSQVYEHVKDPGDAGCGELRLVSVLPNGTASALDASLGTFNGGIPGESRVNSVTNAVSADGSLVFWSARNGGSISLYVRDMNIGKTAEIVSSDLFTTFRTAAPDGSKAIYTEGSSLYEFDTAKALAGEAASTLIAEGVKGVAGSSDDLSRVYFVSTKALGGEGEAGEPNLYLREAGATNLVAPLYAGPTPPEGDLTGNYPHYGFAVGQSSKIANGVRVSADGSHLAFASFGSPTGYDNTDIRDGKPSLELYLYDAVAGELRCVSCNPTGARPVGKEFKSENRSTVRVRVSAHMAAAFNQFFAPRALSADGNRLFFESFEALLARDTNGKGDVYEWQRSNSQAQCDEQGAELYVPSSGGCLSLISTGQNPVDSEFADASPDGSDVFIRTSSSLLPQDPGQVDLYDARVGGGLPQPPAPPAACEGEACQGPLAPPNDPTPASAAFEGAGNATEAPVASCRKPKVRRKGHCVAKKSRKQAKRAKTNRRAGR